MIPEVSFLPSAKSLLALFCRDYFKDSSGVFFAQSCNLIPSRLVR